MSLKVLFIALEFSTWKLARHWSYGAQLAFEEGFKENEVEYCTITTHFIPQIREICSGMQFDQVWVEIVHNNIDESIWEWLVENIPIRIGIICESLEYSDDECNHFPVLKERRSVVENKFKYLTHTIVSDELDAERISSKYIPSFWLAHTVPKSSILYNSNSITPNKCGAFAGSVYGQRANFLSNPKLKGLLIKQPSPEEGTFYPYQFNAIQFIVRAMKKYQVPCNLLILQKYLSCLRNIRKKSYVLWLKSLQDNTAVINLPSMVKAYPGRVVEGMAAGRPVISCEILDRPKNKALFDDGEDILLYSKDNPQQLAEHIKRLIMDPQYAEKITLSARLKIEYFHTTSKRVNEILKWVENGDIPSYIL